MIKAVLFDFGGTLDTGGVHWSEKLWEIYESFNLPVAKEQFEEAFVTGEKRLKSYIKEDDNLEETFTKKIKTELEYLIEKELLNKNDLNIFLERVVNECLEVSKKNFVTVKKLFNEIKKSYKIAVVSNYYGNLETILKENGFDKFTDAVVDSSRVNIFKPDPGIFGLALKNINEKSADALVVGDSYSNDIKPAKMLGCSTIWLDVKSWTKPDDTAAADYIIHSITELYDLLM